MTAGGGTNYPVAKRMETVSHPRNGTLFPRRGHETSQPATTHPSSNRTTRSARAATSGSCVTSTMVRRLAL